MRVKIRHASFAGVFPHNAAGLPQFAFAGRSNVGKSSLINRLVGRKALVRISKVPGKTRAVNLFQVDLVDLPSLYLVDLPGYGYAKAPKSISRGWQDLIGKYLDHNRDLRLLVLLVDIRRDLEEEEHMLIDLMEGSGAQVVLAATKTDKVSFGQRMKRASELSLQSGLQPVMTSATSGEGMDGLWSLIVKALQEN